MVEHAPVTSPVGLLYVYRACVPHSKLADDVHVQGNLCVMKLATTSHHVVGSQKCQHARWLFPLNAPHISHIQSQLCTDTEPVLPPIPG